MAEKINAIEHENKVLRERLAARVKLDTDWKGSLADTVNAVAHNVKMLSPDDQLRVLLAVAVLYGHIRPGEPEDTTLVRGASHDTKGPGK